MFDALNSVDMVLTPHICSPTGDVGHPLDKDLMRTGIYNLGFIAMNNKPEILDFINWWDKRVKAFGYHDLKNGFFYDQIWLGYAPAFLEKVSILRHLGYNVANWNLHERKIIGLNGNYFVNTDEIPLRFFHFSHFKINDLPVIASYNQNFNLDNRPDIVPVFEEYKKGLEANGYNELQSIEYVYGKKQKQKSVEPVIRQKNTRRQKSWQLFKKLIKTIIKG